MINSEPRSRTTQLRVSLALAALVMIVLAGWKVYGQTFCELLAVQGPLPAVCKMASATTLPG